MSSALIPDGRLRHLAQLADQALNYAAQAHADNTVRAYAADWRDFTAWCAGQAREALPASPETAALYFTAAAETRKVSTLSRRGAAISQAHQLAGFDSPTQHIAVRKVMAGIRRAKGTAQTAKRPALTEDLRSMVRQLNPDEPIDVRDRALVLLGFAGAFRRSELVGLVSADLDFRRDGLVVRLRRSKTDPEAEGREVGIPYGSHAETCPVRAVQDWISLLDPPEGRLFRPVNRHRQILPRGLSAQSIALVVKRLAGRLQLDVRHFAGHSLRAGFATAAAAAGVPERAIMAQTGHRSLTTLRKYIRGGSLFLENAAAKVGL